MRMLPFWGKIIRGRWPSLPGAALVLLAATCPAQTLETRTRAWRDNPTAEARAALMAFAAAHPRDREGALALLAVAASEIERGRLNDAGKQLREARPRLAAIDDYVAFYLASAELAAGNFASAAREAQVVWSRTPPSPLAGEAALLGARAYREEGSPAEAVTLLRARYASLPQPAGDALLAACARAANDLATATAYYQRVFTQAPASTEAEQAATALRDLKAALGELYTPLPPEGWLQRAEKLVQAGEYRRARDEYEALVPLSTGAQRDLARVRIGVVGYLLYQNISAYNYLNSLVVEAPEADAERLYYVMECGRRLEREDAIRDALARLEQRHATAPWRLKALVSAGNRHLVENQAEQFVPLYRACYETFPDDTRADYCYWKVAWHAYRNRRAEAAEMLRTHLEKFPGSERASAALYFLGRLAEARQDFESAKAYYSEASERFGNHFYGDAAGRRLTEPAVFKSPASQMVTQFLRTIVWPVTRHLDKFEPTDATQARLERAKMLSAAGLELQSERELRFGASQDGQPHVLALEIAGAVSRYDSPHRAMRLIKNLVPAYLSIPLEDAPAAFWRVLYPLPWRDDLERHARRNGLDPFLVAGLIRQESEFNPQAVSPARAYGLTQIMPATGRALLKMSRRRFRPTILFRPELNLRLGTTYLRDIVERYADKWELVLASYNAGGSRVEKWLTWGEYSEPAEFIETIPFTETRTYVTAVLRNALIYRRLYDGNGLLANGLKPAAKQAAPKKGEPFERSPVVPKKKTTGRR